MVSKMGKVTIYLHKSVQDAVDLISDAVDTSRSEIVEDCIRHILDNDLEEELWGEDYTEGIAAIKEIADEADAETEESEEGD